MSKKFRTARGVSITFNHPMVSPVQGLLNIEGVDLESLSCRPKSEYPMKIEIKKLALLEWEHIRQLLGSTDVMSWGSVNKLKACVLRNMKFLGFLSEDRCKDIGRYNYCVLCWGLEKQKMFRNDRETADRCSACPLRGDSRLRCTGKAEPFYRFAQVVSAGQLGLVLPEVIKEDITKIALDAVDEIISRIKEW
jgi:hypothetical protein